MYKSHLGRKGLKCPWR